VADPLKSKTQEHMQALCRKISVAHDLDPEIQKELYGHMEDKLLAYLSGEEPVTEEDAFILVREHFGDPAVLKGLLQGVHAPRVHVSLVRRLAAAAVATMGLLIVAHLLHSLVALLLVLWAAREGATGNLVQIRNLCAVCLSASAAVLLWPILRHWQRRVDGGQRLWFLQWRPISIIGLIALLLVLMRLVPDVLTEPGVLGDSARAAMAPFLHLVIFVLGWFRVVIVPVLWLWWCDRPPRGARTLAHGFLGWFAFRLTMTSSMAVVMLPRMALHVGHTDPGRMAITSGRLAYGRIFESSFYWNLHFCPLGSYAPGTASFFARYHFMERALETLVLGAAAVLLYGLCHYVYHRYTERVQPT